MSRLVTAAGAPADSSSQLRRQGTLSRPERPTGWGLRFWVAIRPWAELIANHTVLFRMGSTVWVTYGAFVALGGVVGSLVSAAMLAGWGLSVASIAGYQAGLAVSALVGGRLVWLCYEWRLVVREPRTALRRVGFVSFGGYLALLGFTAAFAQSAQLDVLGFYDRSVPVGLLISACGRLGCLSYGCCYGRPSAHGLRWTSPEAKVNRERGVLGSVPRVPTPLLSAVGALVASAVGLGVLTQPSAPGSATALAILTYAALRFGVEVFRDERRFASGRFTRGQLGAMVLGVAATLLWGVLPLHGVDGARPYPSSAGVRIDPSAVATFWPVALVIGLFIFLVTGYHRQQVGRW